MLPQILLISGSGRNCGKTSLACALIKQVSASNDVVALKISPHFHQLSEKQELIFGDEKIKIYRETEKKSGKDSARMLQAGACESIYLQSEDNYLLDAWEKLEMVLPKNKAVVCESGSLANLFKPALHLLVESANPDRMKRSYLKNKAFADRIINFDGTDFNFDLTTIYLTGKEWKIKENQNDQIRRSA